MRILSPEKPDGSCFLVSRLNGVGSTVKTQQGKFYSVIVTTL